jgi:RNA polymerase sigma factor (sigma-70 family)
MIDRRQDFDLLRRFVQEGEEAAFAELVRLHLDIVFATALRKLGDAGGAQDVAQNVFISLAQKAWRFSPEDSLPAWLHRATLLESRQWLRGELRRRRREQTAAELGTTMKTSDDEPAIRALLPLLDEALLSISERDRTALLLRFYERRSLRDVGSSLGTSEDTAQKRVAAALERLAAYFQRRGFRTAGTAAAAMALQQAATAAPSAVSQSVMQAVVNLAPPAASGFTALLARIAALPKAQTIAVCVVLAVTPASLEWSKAKAASARASQIQSAIESMRDQSEQASAQNERLKTKLAALANSQPPPNALVPDRRAAVAQNFAALKARLATAGAVVPYNWPDDLPFVRVPKSALGNVSSDIPAFGPQGRLAPWIKELLNLSERQVADLETDLGGHLAAMDRLAANRASETNWVDANGTYHNQVKIPALEAEGQLLEDTLATNLVNMLGVQQAQLVLSPFKSPNQWLSSEKVSHFLIKEAGEFELSVRPNSSGAPSVSMVWQNHLGSGGPIDGDRLPPFLAQRYVPWLEQNGLTNGVFAIRPQ